MPRAKSEITNGPVIGVRVTKEEHEVYKKLGGGRWLRAYLREILGRKAEDAEANSTTARGMVAVYPAQPKPLPTSAKTRWFPG
jgi:hypothetical protein